MSSEAADANDEELRRRLLWEPCETKEELHTWCRVFLGIDFPDHVVSRHSNSSPMDMIWEAYDLCRHSDPEAGAYHILNYAARTSFKTLAAAAFEVLATLHLERDVSHMAAIESQAQKAQSYVKQMMRRPHIRPFLVGDNKREILVRRYVDRETGHSLTEKEWKSLTAVEQENHKQVERAWAYEEDDRYIKIIIATTQGANSEHTAIMIVDEVDVIPNVAAFEESKSIPEGRGEQIPLTLMISTRKSATGLVQKEIDGAEQSGLMVRHWNLIDITAPCQPDRHKPHLPKLTVYRSPSLLRHVTPEVFDAMSTKDQNEFIKDIDVMAGCGNCRLYAMCQGDLVNQKSESKLLRSIPKVIAAFTKGGKSLDYVHAQLMCDKPSMVGRVYPRFERRRHIISPAQAYEMVFGESPSEKIGGERLTKAALTEIFAERGLPFWGGMDFGDAHPFAFVFGVQDGARGFVLRALGGSHLEPDEQIALCEPLKKYRPDIYPDMSAPGAIRILKKAGFRMKKWKKMGGTVNGGIDIVQAKLCPVGSDVPEMYLVMDIYEDREIDFLVEQIEGYSWEMGPDGRPTGRPVKKDDDFCDAWRYGTMNVWPMKAGNVSVPTDDTREAAQLAESNGRLIQNPQYNWAEETIARLTGNPYHAPEAPVRPPMKVERVVKTPESTSYYASEDADAEAGKKKGRKGRLSWDFS